MTENALPKYKLMNLNSPHPYRSVPIPPSKHTFYLSALFSDSFRPAKPQILCPFENSQWQSWPHNPLLLIITLQTTDTELYLGKESSRRSVLKGSCLGCASTDCCPELHILSCHDHVCCDEPFCHTWLYLGLHVQASHGVSHFINS